MSQLNKDVRNVAYVRAKKRHQNVLTKFNYMALTDSNLGLLDCFNKLLFFIHLSNLKNDKLSLS